MLNDYSTISGVRWLCDWSADAQLNVIDITNMSKFRSSKCDPNARSVIQVWSVEDILDSVIAIS